jgi:hypothetical protein
MCACRVLGLACLGLLLALMPAQAAVTYHVATTGNNANLGTPEQPWRTIQQCATVADAGDLCTIHAGTYRETVTPAHSGTAAARLTLQPAPGDTVILSGADVVTGWTAGAGAVYTTTGMTWDLGAGQNQVFVDGAMMTEARWPNAGTELSHPIYASASGGTPSTGESFGVPADPAARWTLTDAALTQPAGALVGATLVFLSNNSNYIAQSGIVTANSTGSVTFQPQGNRYGLAAGTRYFVTGTPALLDTAREWVYNGTTLTLWTPTGDSPAGHTVEVKRRQHAFDLSGKAYITLGAFQLMAAAIKTDMTTHHILLDGIQASYVSHQTRIDSIGSGWWGGWDTGIQLHGNDNVLQNCTIAYSAGNGVELLGTHQTVTACTIHDVDYLAMDAAPIYAMNRGDSRVAGATGFPSTLHQITNNTMYKMARAAIQHEHTTALTIRGNTIYNAALQTSDTGYTYTWQYDNAGTEIAYNVMYASQPYGYASGVYVDSTGSNILVHHNVIRDVGCGYNAGNGGANSRVYNNTIPGPGNSICGGGTPDTHAYNNITAGAITGIGDLQQNLQSTNPGYVNAAAGDFRLQPGSPAIDAGRIIAGITDGFVGAAPDQGAYELGGQDWTAGAGGRRHFR